MTTDELLAQLETAQAQSQAELNTNKDASDAITKALEHNERLTKALGDECPYASLADE